MNKQITQYAEGIVRVQYEGTGCDREPVAFSFSSRTVLRQIRAELISKPVFRTVPSSQFLKKETANGEVTVMEEVRREFERYSHTALVEFRTGPDELLLGLGQYEDGIFNYRGKREYLYESNMRIAIPLLVTTGNYAVYIDSQSNMIFSEDSGVVRFEIDTADTLSYYIFTGNSLAELISLYQSVTGKASMLPQWAFGYIQSKERYRSSEDLLLTARQFRERKIPVSCLVQDWYTWKEGLWGEKTFDPQRYPDLPAVVNELHEMGIRFMVSVWPNMSPESTDYAEFQQKDYLLPNSNVYDAFSPAAGELYFDQCSRQILAAGTDALWCDNAEPFSDADWSGAVKRHEEDRYAAVTGESKKSIVWEKLNAYGLFHAKNIWENWRKRIPDKRVVNLIRSGYAGSQRYGTILWSGDITAKWDTLRRQITEGLKMGLSGHPYWTLDIGGFFVVKDKYENRGCNSTSREPLWFWDGDYNDGVMNRGYCELYTRWLEFGTFLPVFRSHGTDTPREPWQFENTDPRFCRTITHFIKLRYQLMPYIYSLGAMAHFDSYILMRALAFDFPDDPDACGRSDEYMFGPALLIAPVLEAMYYDVNGQELADVPKARDVYLPSGPVWYDFWTGESYEGGQTVSIPAPLDRIPVLVRSGSIIPMRDSAADPPVAGVVDTVRIYGGSDGEFSYYYDSGDGWEFEQDSFCRVRMCYTESDRTFQLTDAQGRLPLPVIRRTQFFRPE